MKIEAPPRGTSDTWDDELQAFRPNEERVDIWILRVLDQARATDSHRLDDLKVTVGTVVYEELMTAIRELLRSARQLTQIYGAELVVDHQLTVPFVVTWSTWEERVLKEMLLW